MHGRDDVRLTMVERRNLACIERLIGDLSMQVEELEQEIAVEETRVGISDPMHFAYPSYAKAAVLRRDNLLRTVEELKLRHVQTSIGAEDVRHAVT
jgi:hypothetical protein